MKDKNEIREMLRDSLETQVAVRYLVTGAILAVIFILMGMRELRYMDPEFKILGTAMISAIGALPVLLFGVIRLIRIFRKPESYHFCKANLCNPKGGNLRHTIRFTVLLEDSQGRKFSANTHSIFYARGLIGPLLEDYVNKTVTIAYNEETGIVVVIG